MRVPSPEGHNPCGRGIVGIIATCSNVSVLNTFTAFSPQTVTYANGPYAVRAKWTGFVIGTVSITLTTANGGRALNPLVLPTSLSVSQTCLPSGLAAMSGQNGLSCFTCPTILCSAVAMTTVSGLKLEQTYPYFPSGENIVIPGPFGTVMRVLSLKVWPSRTAI